MIIEEVLIGEGRKVKRYNKEEKLNFISSSLFSSLLFAVNSVTYDEDEEVPFIILVILIEQIKEFLSESGFTYRVQKEESEGSDDIRINNFDGGLQKQA